MNENMDQISPLIARIRWMRLGLLPPYCHDGDEGERSEDDYVRFYRDKANASIAATANYVASIAAVDENTNEGITVANLLSSRRAFIDAFPFCADELANEPQEPRAALEEYMLGKYKGGPGKTAALLSTLNEYREIITELRDQLGGQQH